MGSITLPFKVNDNDSVTSAPGWGATAIWNSRVVGSKTSTWSWAPTSRLMSSPLLSVISADHGPAKAEAERQTRSLGDDRVDVSPVDADRRSGGGRRQRRTQVGDHGGDLVGLDQALQQRLRSVLAHELALRLIPRQRRVHQLIDEVLHPRRVGGSRDDGIH